MNLRIRPTRKSAVRRILGFFIFAFAFSLSSAFATPAQVIMIRHAEKPNDVDIHLSERGYERAKALVGFFLGSKEFQKYGPPVAIYAMGQRKKTTSVRAIETVTPLAEELGMTINDNYTRDEYDEAAEEILTEKQYDGKLVIICWEHDALSDFASELGFDDAPDWGSEYDRAWILDYRDDEVARFRDVPQRLLDGDDEE